MYLKYTYFTMMFRPLRFCFLFYWILVSSCQEPTTTSPTVYPTTFPTYFGNYTIPAANPLTYQGIELGRMLFYEKQLSLDNSMSCASCHQQKYAFSDGLGQSVGVQGRKREVGSMALVNLLWQTKFTWTGQASSLEQQVLMPIQHVAEMNQTIPETISKLRKTTHYSQKFMAAFGSTEITEQKIAYALAQFLRTLVSSDAKFDKYLRGEVQLTAQEQQGRELLQHPYAGRLRGGNCIDCHIGLNYVGSTSGFDGFRNNGLATDEQLQDGLFAVTKQPFDKGKFKVPTLRNIALTAPYMHDGRFKTLDEVLDHYNDHVQLSKTIDPLILEATNELFPPTGQVKLGLTTQEKQAIIAFLKTLTDEKFITNPAFASPF